MASPDFQVLLETVIEELTEAVPHLEAAQSAMTEAWSRISAREEGNPDTAMQAMIQGIGGLLTWVESVKKGTE